MYRIHHITLVSSGVLKISEPVWKKFYHLLLAV